MPKLFFNILFSLYLVTHTLLAGALDDLDSIVESALETFAVPGTSVGVVVDNKIVLAKGYGTCCVHTEQAVTPHTLFAIGSCTKAFTAFILAQLVEEGLVRWDEKVVTYLPAFSLMDSHATTHLTVRDLLSHRSGLPRHDFVWYNADLSRSELLNRLAHLEPSFDLREKFQYNNMMFLVAGLVIESVTGQSWEEAVFSRLFVPLGMERSNFSVAVSQQGEDFACPHALVDEKVCQVAFRNISTMGPAGSINASVLDMLQWIKVHLSDGSNLISKETLKEMHTLQMPFTSPYSDEEYHLGYGLGWMLGVHKGHYVVFHGGGIDGFISQVVLFPQKGIGIVVLSNQSETGGGFVRALSCSIIDRLLSADTPDRISELHNQYKRAKATQRAFKAAKNAERIVNTTPSHPLEGYVGEFENPGYGCVKFSLEEGRLFLTYNQMKSPLNHWQYDCFVSVEQVCSLPRLECWFDKDTAGRIAEVRIPFEPALAPISFKRS